MWRRLSAARKDAETLHELLKDQYGFTDATLLVDEDATYDAVLEALEDLVERSKEGDLVFVYFAGHGSYLGRNEGRIRGGCWILHDSRTSREGSCRDALGAKDVISYLEAVKAKHVLLATDSCFSGTFAMRGGMHSSPSGDFRSHYLNRLRRGSKKVLTSGDPDREVQDHDSSGHSSFARAVLTALRETATGYVSAGDLLRAVEETYKPLSKDYSPSLESLPDSPSSGEFVFIRNEVQAALRLKKPESGLTEADRLRAQLRLKNAQLDSVLDLLRGAPGERSDMTDVDLLNVSSSCEGATVDGAACVAAQRKKHRAFRIPDWARRRSTREEKLQALPTRGLLRTASVLVRNQKWLEVALELKRVVAENPEVADAEKVLFNAGIAFFRAQHFESAANVLENVLSRKGFEASGLHNPSLALLAQVYERLLWFEDAIATLRGLLGRAGASDAPEQAYWLSQIAMLHEASGDHLSAARGFEAYVVAYPKEERSAAYLKQAADLYGRLGETANKKRALSQFEERYRKTEGLAHRGEVDGWYVEALAGLRQIAIETGDDEATKRLGAQIVLEFASRGQGAGSPSAEAAASSRFGQIDQGFEPFAKLRFDAEDDIKAASELIKQKLILMTELLKEYREVLEYQDPYWTVAATGRLGDVYAEVAECLYQAGTPAMIPHLTTGLSGEAEDLYVTMVEDRAVPLEDKAIEFYKRAASSVRLGGMTGEWATRALRAAHRYHPAEFPLDETEISGSSPEASDSEPTKAEIEAVILRRVPDVRDCYEKALKENEGLQGTVVLKITIGLAGRVTSSEVAEDSTSDPILVPCMTAKVRSWRFPRPGRSPLVVTYPFHFVAEAPSNPPEAAIRPRIRRKGEEGEARMATADEKLQEETRNVSELLSRTDMGEHFAL